MREAYRKAISLAGAELLINESDVGRVADLAHYHAVLGDAARAERLIASAIDAGTDDPSVYYSAAVVYAQSGDIDKAIDSVETALEHGYPVFLIEKEPLLLPLQSSEQFLRLVEPVAKL